MNSIEKENKKYIDFLNKIKEKYNDEETLKTIEEIKNELEIKTYSLVFENHYEEIEELIKNNITVLEEIEERKIVANNKDKFNFLIEGDNLHSLKILEKTHKNKIDVIYIDPPYNTGGKNSSFVYKDNFRRKFDKHSRWLSFMKKRLEIAKELLKDDGVIFISIDEHEVFQLKLLMDEIYGENNFIENFIWIKNSTKNLSKTTSTNHEYILCYAKDKVKVSRANMFRSKKDGFDEVLKLVATEKEKGTTIEETQIKLKEYYKNNKHLKKGITMYNLIDEDWRIYRDSNMSSPSSNRGKQYEILHPITKKPTRITSRGWRYPYETMQEHIKNGRILFGKDENKVPRFKRYLTEVETEIKKSIIENFNDGKKELLKIFGKDVFNNAKPTSLIRDILSTFKKDITVLDFFAGSGTTGHAIVALNKEDGGNRTYILCTNNENNICEDITYERLKKIQNELPHNLKYYKASFVK